MKISDTLQRKFAKNIAIERKHIAWQDFRLILLGAIALLLLVGFDRLNPAAFGEEITLLQPLRVVLGLGYILFIPGYCLTTALFPRADDLSIVERLGLSIGLSIASDTILALVLDRSGWGLFPWPVLLGEFGMTGIFISITLWRRARIPAESVYAPELTWQPRSWWDSLSNSDQRLSKILAAFVLLISGLAMWLFLAPKQNQFMTEFYILGPDGLVANYPYQVKITDEVSVKVGVINHEKNKVNYHFEVWVTDSLNPDRRERVLQSDPFSLEPGEKLEQTISWRMPWVGDNQKVELLLFYNNDANSSRQLRMWINTITASSDEGLSRLVVTPTVFPTPTAALSDSSELSNRKTARRFHLYPTKKNSKAHKNQSN